VTTRRVTLTVLFVPEHALQGKNARGAFDEIIAPLEQAAGWRLYGKNRRLCQQAFRRYPEGFRACAAKALLRADPRKANFNPIGLFVKMVLIDEEHCQVLDRPHAQRSPLERALAWAETVGGLLSTDHREEILGGFDLTEDEAAQVRARLLDQGDSAS
jgi:hypothetical protein